ncbi:MAG: c-type cytochrome [Bacteroidetes bacterium]|nr:MAG: c-type cytochrome [Bacteroidota bacterium]
MLKLHRRKLIISTALLAVIIFSVAATAPDKPPKRNLKVLPKNISHDDLSKVMDNFKAALGVRCDFCHAKSATDANKLDFASDAKEEKETARHMMKMTAKINKKYFNFNKPEAGQEPMLAVTCVTCHRGNPHPESK